MQCGRGARLGCARPCHTSRNGIVFRGGIGNPSPACRGFVGIGISVVMETFFGYNESMPLLERESLVISDPQVMDGLPVIRGTRIAVYLVLEMLESGMTIDQIVTEYPHLTADQVRAAVRYALDLSRTVE